MEITKQLQMQLLKDTEAASDDMDENKKDSRKYRMEPEDLRCIRMTHPCKIFRSRTSLYIWDF